VRIARFTTGDDPRFAVVDGETGQETLAVVTGDPLVSAVRFTGERIPVEGTRLLSPVLPRSKVIAIGGNSSRETGEDGPGEPQAFLKPNTSVVGPDDPVVLPPWSSEVHCEGELAVVIGRICRDLPRHRVPEVVVGYTCANDVTARDRQGEPGGSWRAKGADSFCPLGPFLVTDLDTSDLRIRTRLDGDTVQDGRTGSMRWDVADLVCHVSTAMTLLPGDVLLTGTPVPSAPMSAGQRVEVEVEGIGTLSNPVVVR
jgi:2-keto-4-pentenoate hydratase/2-oxohepta-3-ene-1,7-dioic acid hydratase in catechol pathway